MRASRGKTRYYGARKFFGKPLYRLTREDFLALVRRYGGAQRLLDSPAGRSHLCVCLYHTRELLDWDDLKALAEALGRFSLEDLSLAADLYHFAVIANVVGHSLMGLNRGCFSSESQQAFYAKNHAIVRLMTDFAPDITVTYDRSRPSLAIVRLKHSLFHSEGLHTFRSLAERHHFSPSPPVPSR